MFVKHTVFISVVCNSLLCTMKVLAYNLLSGGNGEDR